MLCLVKNPSDITDISINLQNEFTYIQSLHGEK